MTIKVVNQEFSTASNVIKNVLHAINVGSAV